MPPSAPIKITLYGQDDADNKTFQRLIVPWGFLKRAIRLSKDMNAAEITEEQVDAISDLLIEFFRNVFNREELEAGADVSEILACFQAIVNKAKGLLPNPPPPAS